MTPKQLRDAHEEAVTAIKVSLRNHKRNECLICSARLDTARSDINYVFVGHLLNMRETLLRWTLAYPRTKLAKATKALL